MSTISQRDAFWNEVYDIARKDKDVIVVTADMGAPALDRFRTDLAGQFINVGIAEQQAVLLSSGLALEGKKVLAYAIAPFITLRCYEQIKIEMAAMNIPVTLVGVGAGFSYDDSGPTHHTVEDLSIMRILPNLLVHNITDTTMARAFARTCCQADAPRYIRLDREVLPTVYNDKTDFSSGHRLLRDGADLLLVGTGNMVHRALEVASALKDRGVEAGVMDLFTLPIREEPFLAAVRDAKRIVTLEEHTLPGGMGAAVSECLSDNNLQRPMKRFGLRFETTYCYRYGGRSHMQSLYGLDKAALTRGILEWME